MENNTIFANQQRILHGFHLAQKKLFVERALHGQTIIVGDGNGGSKEILAADYLAQHKEFFDSL